MRKIKPSLPEESEFVIQCQVVEYLELLQAQGKILAFTAIPNSTFTTSWSVKMKNKRSGVRPGHPDLLIVSPTHALYLELKKKRGGTVSINQKAWIEHLKDKKTVSAVCAGFESAKEFIDKEL